MLLLALSVEGLFHKLNHFAHHSKFWHGVISAIEKELMILGMISFLLFMIEQGLSGLHIEHFGEVIEISHFTHLLLFFSMIAYYTFLVIVGLLTNSHLQVLHKFELSIKKRGAWSAEYEQELLEKSKKRLNWGWKSREWELYVPSERAYAPLRTKTRKP